jgi:Flp pilus assembly protein TadB
MRLLKLILALAGLGLAVASEALHSTPLVYAAMGCLAAALALRLFLRRKG